ncbi:MAG: hypothetical protein M3R16_03615 [Pseudomonadota bacterium]|nr:hypothetical protein [Pseudomonadota bacterium]
MKNFIEQFDFLSPLALATMEAYFYNLADKMVEGYTGGSWQDLQVGKCRAVQIPAPDSGLLHVIGAENQCDVTTDARTAGIGLSIIVANHFWHGYADKVGPKANAVFKRASQGLKDAAFRDKTVDHSALYSIID